MPKYRFYIFEKNAHVAAPPKIYGLLNNAAALEAASTIHECSVEIWCHTRKIGRLDPHGQPTSKADHRQARTLPRRSAANGLHP
jgi:hypothetical protein